MSDKLVFDLSQEVEGTPNVFIRKDWINILDNMNQNYQSNQSIIDTSQLSNSNKWMSYREAYLAMPLLFSVVSPNTNGLAFDFFDYSVGLKNWFGSMIHSITVDYNGTTIVQQTPFCNMWNVFKLLTSFSYDDIISQGPTIGFYPDTAGSFGFVDAANSKNGIAVVNNDMAISHTTSSGLDLNSYDQYNHASALGGNIGLTYRTKWIAWNSAAGTIVGEDYATLLNPNNMSQIWKSNICNKANVLATTAGVFQIASMAIIQLKHLHSFFNMIPLLKGVFMKITMNLNNASSSITLDNTGNDITVSGYETNVAVGGVLPIVVPSLYTGSLWMQTGRFADGSVIKYNVSVGARCTDSTVNVGGREGNLSRSVYLYVPAYTFNPPFSEAYLSSSPKSVKYTDIYQYQVLNVASNSNFNSLVTNGIANIKSVLIIPFFSYLPNNTTSYNQYQSPFDTAGCGTTAPLVNLGNFNVQISGQNAIYNTQRYCYEEFVNQLYGQFSVNGGLTDGLTSGLINFSDFQNSYCYYYVNVERMLPVEKSVPKSVQILGTNYSQKALNLYVFIEYENEVKIDLYTGARV